MAHRTNRYSIVFDEETEAMLYTYQKANNLSFFSDAVRDLVEIGFVTLEIDDQTYNVAKKAKAKLRVTREE